MVLLLPKDNLSYHFISCSVSTALDHLKRGFLEKGDQLGVPTDSGFELRVAKVTRLLAILG